MRTLRLSKPVLYASLFLLVVLLCKFLWTQFVYGIPLGYDTGIYRYLFINHAEGLPPFSIAKMDPWAYDHPLGLFFFTSILIKLGLPVDWLIGWIWNLVPVLLLTLLAAVTAKREGELALPFVLIAGILSAAYFDGFTGMYWKAYAALLFMVLTLALIDRKSPWAVIPGFLTLVTHHQTGLLFALVIGTWWLLSLRTHWKSPLFRTMSIGGIVVAILAALVYLPVWQHAVGTHLSTIFTTMGNPLAGGNFPPPIEYVRITGLLLLVGIFGFLQTIRRDRVLSPWHLAVLWASVFVVLRLFFYRRFYLHLDFFLLPFAGIGMAYLWQMLRSDLYRGCFLVVLLVQVFFTLQVMIQRTPVIDRESFALIQRIEEHLPQHAHVIALDNVSAPWVRGWVPYHRVGGPGVFALSWSYEDWEKLLLGSTSDRRELLETLSANTFFVVTPQFMNHYRDKALAFIEDPCLEKVPEAPLLKVICRKK